MPNTIRFIDSIIRNIQPGKKRRIFWCHGCPGFGLRITPSGTKTFVFKYMLTSGSNKRISRWITIGKYPGKPIQKARSKYFELYEQVYDYGRDPVGEIQAEKKKKKETYTVEEFIDVYKEYAVLKGKTTHREEERVFRLDILPLVGSKNLRDVTPEDIDEMQARILKRAKRSPSATRNGRVAVKNSLAYTRIFFNYAKKKRLIDTNPVLEVDSMGASVPRTRVLSFEEIWIFWNRIEMMNISPVPAKALKFLLATMQRSNEVRNIHYESVNLADAVWQMEQHETKNHTMHRVPLNRYAIDLINEVEPLTGASKYIFGGTKISVPPKTLNPKLFDQIVTCNSPKDIPTLEELRERVKSLGLLWS